MNGTLRVLVAESVRLAAMKSTYLVGFVLTLVAAARALVSTAAGAAERGGGADDPVSSGVAWTPFVDGWRAGLVLGGLVLLLVSARSLAGDREAGILRLATTRSASRAALVVGRFLMAPVLVLIVVAITGIAAWAAAQGAGDFGPLVEDGYEILTAAEIRGEVVRSVFAILPALLATFAFGLAVSSLIRSPIGAVTSALGVFLAFDLFKEALGEAGAWVFAAHAPTLADSSAWSELPGFVRGFSDAGFPAGLERVGYIVPWPAALMCILVAVIAVRRRPL